MKNKILEVRDILDKGRNFTNLFPHLVAQLGKGNVWFWDSKGYTRELSRENLKQIEDIEKSNEYVVYAVLETLSDFGVMHSYLLMPTIKALTGEYFGPVDDKYWITAKVHNVTHGFEEYGDIVIVPSPGGGPVRSA